MKTEDITMTVIVGGEERQRAIAGYMEPEEPYPEIFEGEVITSFSWVSPMIIQQDPHKYS